MTQKKRRFEIGKKRRGLKTLEEKMEILEEKLEKTLIVDVKIRQRG